MGCIHSAHPTPVERLVRSTIENTPKLSFDGQTILAKVLEVHDGDTITVAFIVEGLIFQGKCRLEGIDTAEIVQVRNEQERKVGIQGRDYLSKLILNQMVTIRCPRGEHDKYGRALIGTVFLDGDCPGTSPSGTPGPSEVPNPPGLNINDEMIAKGFAYRYYGGKKKKFSEWYGVAGEAKQTFWQCCGNSVEQTKRCSVCQSWCCNGCKDSSVHRKTTVKCGKCRDHCPDSKAP